jgi:SET domain-containing protein
LKRKTKSTDVNNAEPVLDSRYCNYKLRVAPSKIHRWGVYADEFIPARRKIIEYTGEKVSRRETKRRSQGPLNYLFTLNAYWCIDGNVGGSGAQYVNHCCEPNVYAWIVKDHILYMSARDIEPGEELTLDYHFDKDVERVPCSCGAARCRGTINLLD